MTKANNKVVQVKPKAQAKTLSAAQKQFNSLSKKIDRQKNLLREWKETIPSYHQKVGQEYDPLVETLNQHQLEWIKLLDTFHDQPLFKKTDKAKIKHLIIDVCEDLLVEMETDEVKALFNKYGDEDFDTIKQETDAAVGELMKGLAKEMLDVDLEDDVDLSSPEKFQAYLQEKLREQSATQAQEQTPHQPKKTKKQLAQEARQQEEEALASKSVQEVYRKLVAVLHPDREPDEAERERKTELMQRVNTAYGKKDLLQLLELQLEIEQIDLAHLSQMADSRLKYFNKILKDQLAELDQEIFQIEEAFKLELQMPYYAQLSPKQLVLNLEQDTREVENLIARIKKDLAYFDNATTFKAWLKTYKIPKRSRQDDFDDLIFSGLPFDFR
ncbi:MAG: hypothetical protein PHH59_02490 [Methylovulum sp.]|uniref:hypothetical protein n=1 Tax=Methylovulum sp. TaxID=1916980 RepID=UPI0026087937|nr:hypothetical protein [Methylovulum sp.]MDD2722878.1 hypothetical protein [Methylovulum sp.]MDD5125051.1 hypothetical protein [Methylovulum sp.]